MAHSHKDNVRYSDGERQCEYDWPGHLLHNKGQVEISDSSLVDLVQCLLETNIGEPDGTTHALGVHETQCPFLCVNECVYITGMCVCISCR